MTFEFNVSRTVDPPYIALFARNVLYMVGKKGGTVMSSRNQVCRFLFDKLVLIGNILWVEINQFHLRVVEILEQTNRTNFLLNWSCINCMILSLTWSQICFRKTCFECHCTFKLNWNSVEIGADMIMTASIIQSKMTIWLLKADKSNLLNYIHYSWLL